jgi:hypothetical protein
MGVRFTHKTIVLLGLERAHLWQELSLLLQIPIAHLTETKPQASTSSTSHLCLSAKRQFQVKLDAKKGCQRSEMAELYQLVDAQI